LLKLQHTGFRRMNSRPLALTFFTISSSTFFKKSLQRFLNFSSTGRKWKMGLSGFTFVRPIPTLTVITAAAELTALRKRGERMEVKKKMGRPIKIYTEAEILEGREKQKAWSRESQRKRRARLKASGICIECARHPVGSRVHCDSCRERRKVWRSQRLLSRG
jgi:hypothetical protein